MKAIFGQIFGALQQGEALRPDENVDEARLPADRAIAAKSLKLGRHTDYEANRSAMATAAALD